MTRKVNVRMSNKDRILFAANEMTEVFRHHTTKVDVAVHGETVAGVTQAYITDEGLNILSDVFGRVPIELRAAVYEAFLNNLTDQGYAYSIEQFKGTVH